MKRKIKNLSKILLLIIMVFMAIPNVEATGSSQLKLEGASSVQVGQNVEITLKVSNISGVTEGIASIGGEVSYSKDMLEFVSYDVLYDMGMVEYVKETDMFAAVAFSSSKRLKTDTSVVKFVFKAKKKGTATFSLGNVMVNDGATGGVSDVVSANNPSKSITITDAVAQSSNANLSALSVSGHNISPAFNKDTTEYTLTVPNSVSSVNVTATKEDSNASLTGTGNKSLNVGENTISVVVTAQNGTTKKTYNIKVTREAGSAVQSSDNTLKGLNVSGYDMSPAFNKDTTNYEVTVPNSANEIIVNANKNNDKARVEVIGANNLKVGDNTVTVKVTAENGSVKEYKITVHKEGPVDNTKNGDATLKGLDVSGYTLNPGFNKDVTSYTIYVQSTVDGLRVNATPNNSNAKVEVTGNLGWHDGVNTVQIKVTAENGTTKIYTVNAIRQPAGNTGTQNPSGGNQTGTSNDTALKELTINNAHTMDKAFNANDKSYSVTVPYEVDKLNLSYITNNSKAKVEVTGNENFKVGSVNTVVIKVTAENGNTDYYILNVQRDSEKSGTDIDSVKVNGETVDINKTITVDKDKVNVDVDLTDPSSKYEIMGDKNLKDGHNTVLIKVTDKNGMVKYYELDVYKEPVSSGTFLGLKPSAWGILFGILAFVILLLLLLFLLLKRKKDEDKTPAPAAPTGPVIDFKPEFNFGSRNGTDDDVVYPGGTLNQGSQLGTREEPKKLIDATEATYVEDYEDEDPMFDATITKDELISAIKEGMETKNSDKLKMLLKQDELNQLKKKIKREQEEQRRDKYEE